MIHLYITKFGLHGLQLTFVWNVNITIHFILNNAIEHVIYFI